MPVPPAIESAAHIRAALVQHLSRFLQPLPTAPTEVELSAWIAPLSTLQLVGCLGRTPNETADRLTASLGKAEAAKSPAEAIADVVATEYPELSETRRTRLAEMAAVVRELSRDGDGTIQASDLYARNFRSAEAASLMPAATHVLNVLGGATPPRTAEPPAREATPAERLREAGVRASVRHALN